MLLGLRAARCVPGDTTAMLMMAQKFQFNVEQGLNASRARQPLKFVNQEHIRMYRDLVIVLCVVVGIIVVSWREQ